MHDTSASLIRASGGESMIHDNLRVSAAVLVTIVISFSNEVGWQPMTGKKPTKAKLWIERAGIGGPLIDTFGNFIGLNFYHEKETSYIPRKVIQELLNEFDAKRHKAVTINKGDSNRWVVPEPYWSYPPIPLTEVVTEETLIIRVLKLSNVSHFSSGPIRHRRPAGIARLVLPRKPPTSRAIASECSSCGERASAVLDPVTSVVGCASCGAAEFVNAANVFDRRLPSRIDLHASFIRIHSDSAYRDNKLAAASETIAPRIGFSPTRDAEALRIAKSATDGNLSADND
ncbi:hypothetical protein PR202_ga21640 [Eleusine coracana subsp. coracana]|uniref:Uncharacterized protein n=1 Tax=Eleusine coracana subsp. coracana TaxID=191504 RepID=A0AAV5D118_ELECO|nr:hypothetical protein PR202_ga21640 [Eleusine coracana subsp. coracana]